MPTNPPTRGGRRPGAGRKPISDVRMVVRAVTLPTDVVDTCKTYGDGNLSAGIRAVVAELKRLQKLLEDSF